MERNVEAQIFDDFCLEAVVLVFGAVSLTTLGFIAINSHSVLAGGELGLQQVLLAVLVFGILLRAGLMALGVEKFDLEQFSGPLFFLLWHCILLL
ncbi:hypothetical protein GUITHDRAFT_156292 [Guillardia theta CCMP2712]|uniref:Uncharacterized protein n=1 Tax=Guillardia theta (strain CCMP2712) TaxID=905079 RepID=L1I9L5_GUITC|nr:hypothetical protein GUITHDRAFT_156292 [Guillardia theta CCMP2712]EKX32550.1 hypothetical protein GUITHDRAFT_156292 [Guillardia theta CCMP2712]|eukprot:XP_005819530.1 hypothetical protein GUITHDRAFT_156292 [Guillardia theta CCMP2712]